MRIGGNVWKSRKDSLWLAKIPFLDFMTQASSKEEIPEMVKDAVELLVNDPAFVVDVMLSDNVVYIDSNDPKKLVALILRRLRQKNNLTSQEVASHLGAKSINEYAQYEQGKHIPSMAKFEQLLKAIDPNLTPCLILP